LFRELEARIDNDALILIKGDSASGKSFLINEFVIALEHVQADRWRRLTIHWCALDDTDILGSFRDALRTMLDVPPSSRATMSELLKRACEGRRLLIDVHDFELSQISPSSKLATRTLLQELLEHPEIHLIISTTREVEDLPIDDQRSSRLELDLPDWDAETSTVLQTLIGREPVRIEPQDLRPTMLAAHVFSVLQAQWTDEFADVPTIEEILAAALSGVPDQVKHIITVNDEERKEARVRLTFFWRSSLHLALYRHVLANLPESEKRYVRLLLAWASVDSGFDLFTTEVQDSPMMKPMMDVLRNLTSSSFVQKIFFNVGGSVRLVHSSVLDLYGQDVFADGDQEREKIHARLSEILEAMDGERIRLAHLRHRLRSGEARTAELLRELDPEQFPGLGAASHELALAKREYCSVFLPIPETRSRTRDYVWYQPVVCRSYDKENESLETQILRLTAAVLLADASYQALDDWDEASAKSVEIDGELKALLKEDFPMADRETLERLSNLVLLSGGLFSTMLYEGGAEPPTESDYDFKSGWSAEHAGHSIASAGTFRHALDVHLVSSVRSNHFIALLKARPSREIGSTGAVSLEAYDNAIERIPFRHLEEAAADESQSQLDRLRYVLSLSRKAFLLGGPKAALDELAAGAVPGDPHLMASQEYAYALIQTCFYMLYLGQSPKLDLAQRLAIDSCPDNWARAQYRTVRIWARLLDPKADRQSIAADLASVALRFDMDPKAELACMIGSICVANPDPKSRQKEIADAIGSSDFKKEDCYYRAVLQVATASPDADPRLFERWFPGDEWRKLKFGPIMPGMLIMRGQPVGYVP
jgi:hypothetical protein